MKRFYQAIFLTLSIFISTAGHAKETPKIQLAILLDGSGSMQGLIDQTKNQLWKVVNALGNAKKDGQVPELEVAVFEHGKADIPAEQGYLQRLASLTPELDLISQKLFSIVARGSQEFTGLAISSATDELKWSENEGDYRVIFIAGNETMQQGPVKFQDAIAKALEKGIRVNTIHAGSEHRGVRDHWKEASELGQGRFVNIDTNYQAPHIKSPHDATILKLNEKINATYIPFGPHGELYKQRQLQADRDAGAGLVERSVTKGLSYYRSGSWDLIDALKEGRVKLEDIEDNDLPEAMRAMTLAEKEAYIKVRADRRKALKIALVEVGKLRKEFVDEKLKELTEEQGKSIEAAMVQILKEQLESKGFTLE